MRQYEAMYIVDAELTDDELQPIIEKYSKVVTDGGGTVSSAAKWEQGRRKLAFEINRRREGIYILMHFEAGADVPKELERVFRISDDVFRHLVVRRDETAPPPAPAAPAAETEEAPAPTAAEPAAAEPSAQGGEPESTTEPEAEPVAEAAESEAAEAEPDSEPTAEEEEPAAQ